MTDIVKESLPEIKEEVIARLKECEDSYEAKFSKTSYGRGKIILKNVLIHGQDEQVIGDTENDGTNIFKPGVSDKGKQFLKVTAFIPTAKRDELVDMIEGLVSGELNGSSAHQSYNKAKFKRAIRDTDPGDQYSMVRIQKPKFEESVIDVNEHNEGLSPEDDDFKRYSPFYYNLQDFSRVNVKYYLNGNPPLSSDSFKYSNSFKVLMPDGTCSVLGYTSLIKPKNGTYAHSSVEKFNEKTLEELGSPDHKEGDIGMYALADISFDAYVGLKPKFFVGLNAQVVRVKEIGFNYSSDVGEVTEDEEAMFSEASASASDKEDDDVFGNELDGI